MTTPTLSAGIDHRARCPMLRVESFDAQRIGKPSRGPSGEIIDAPSAGPVRISRCLDCGAQITEEIER